MTFDFQATFRHSRIFICPPLSFFRPWEDESDYPPSRARSTTTPFMPQQPSTTPHPPRVSSPVNPIRPGYTQKAQTLPSRLSPGGAFSATGGGGGGTSGYESSIDVMGGVDKGYGTDFSSARSDDLSKSPVNGHHHHHHHASSPSRVAGGENIRISSTYTQSLQAAVPKSRQFTRSAGDVVDLDTLPGAVLRAPNVYPLHLLFTTNYRLPGDVDRCNLEKHLSDAEFDMVFRMSREDFYLLPYWKRCDLKRRYYLF